MTRVDETPPGRARIEQADRPQPSDAQAELRYNPLGQLVLARMKEFYRHPSAIFWVYIFPVLMTIVLGVAFQSPPRQIFVVDIENASPTAAVVAAALAGPLSGQSNQGPEFRPQVVSPDVARQRLRTGRSALVIIPAAGGKTPAEAEPAAGNLSESSPLTLSSPTRGEGAGIGSPTRGEGAKNESHGRREGSEIRSEPTSATAAAAQLNQVRLTYLFDPTRPESQAARWAVDDALQRSAGRGDPLAVSDSKFDEPGSRYIDFLVPGLIGASLMSGGLWGVGFVVVDMRVRNLLKRFVTTPMKKSHFLLGLMLSRFFFIVSEVVLLLFFAWFLFGVAVMGSWLALAVLVVIGAWTFAGIGLLVACRARTLETASGVINLVMLPMWLVSGIFFSSERFPAIVQPAIKALPLTAVIDGLRAIMIEGASFERLGLELAVLLVWSAVSFAVSLRFFRWY